MNKKIKQATSEEIKNEYEQNVASVKHARNSTKSWHYNDFDGKYYRCMPYSLELAKQDDLELAWRLCESCDMRAYRLHVRARKMVESQKAIFVTLTFSDQTLSSNSADSLAQYVRRFLSSQCSEYVANIDFGADNKRLHYHALCVPSAVDALDLTPWRKYGAINVERVRKSADYLKVSNYINKLTNHALKDNGFYKRLIFSRKTTVKGA